jgi:predicted XRE-type DNA-binding protein
LKPRLDSDGYVCITLGTDGCRRCTRVHNLVGKLFLDNPNKLPELHHLDYDRTNPKVDNLQWISHKDNVKISANLGKYKNKTGENNNNSKLKEEQVKEIRNMYNNGFTRYRIAKMFNVSWSMVDFIVKRKNWTNI